jgi:hypothetical protein
VRGRDFWIAAVLPGLLLFPALATVAPVPSWRVNTWPYIFAVYLALGMVWVVILHRGTPGLDDDVKPRGHLDHGHSAAAAPDALPAQRRSGIVR